MLGGGRPGGIAHVLALEALGEMGISPVAIAGTFMGIIVGGAYAAGIKGRAIRNHLLRVLSNRSDVMSDLLRAGLDGSLISCCAAVPILYCGLPRFVVTCSGFLASFRESRCKESFIVATVILIATRLRMVPGR
jgi:hypothetical protein